ncbi:uncharacterized protein VTP21DRAFT_11617 [Calcarisporiella thermophila]|uniref:uncharacterized protein n=1 Tax=Calcarisporiella thermophila TaxID=911321 RepID=UPI003742B7C2
MRSSFAIICAPSISDSGSSGAGTRSQEPLHRLPSNASAPFHRLFPFLKHVFLYFPLEQIPTTLVVLPFFSLALSTS